MNKTELITKIQTEGYSILQEREGDIENGYKHWAVAGIREVDGTGTRKWFHFYERTSDGVCLWADKDPFYEPVKPVRFSDELDQYIQGKINDGTILAGFVEDISEGQETAIARAVQDDGSGAIVEKRYLLNKDADGNFQITPLG